MHYSADDLECAGCGYSLRGLPDCVCPERGLAFNPEAMLAALAAGTRLRISEDTARAASWIATMVAIISVIATPLVGLECVERRAYSIGACSTHLRSNDDLLTLLAILAIASSWTIVMVTLSAGKHIVLARAASLATTTAWLTMWLIVGDR